MKLLSLTPAQLEHDKTAMAVRMVFERDGKQVSKVAAVTGVLAKCSRNHRLELRRVCVKMAREADRDLAFMIYGEDHFREHCEFNSNYWGALTIDEKAKIEWPS